MFKFLIGFILGGIAGIFLMCLLQINKGKEKQMSKIKCSNCGKVLENSEERYVVIGNEIYYVCKKCKEICEKFKQRNDV